MIEVIVKTDINIQNEVLIHEFNLPSTEKHILNIITNTNCD